MSADGLISESECNPSYVPPNDSPLLPDGINLVKKEESHGGTNVTLMYKNFATIAFLKICDQIFQFCVFSLSIVVSITFRIYDVLQNYVATSTSFIHRCFLQKLSLFVLPALYGLLMVLFSWLLVFYDSKVPGVFPPTPLSPKKHRCVLNFQFFYFIYT